MNSGATTAISLPRSRFSYGWMCVIIASLAMTATLPGRTHGLSLVTEPLLKDLQLERTDYARINLLCTLLGTAFCWPVGLLIDRRGVRITLAGVLLLLGLSVIALTRVTTSTGFFWALLCIRGFGQGALSVVSMALIGKWFQRRLGAAMGVFSVLLTIGFIVSILTLGDAIKLHGWRHAWGQMGFVLLGFSVVAWLLTRNGPKSLADVDEDLNAEETSQLASDLTLLQALRTPAFWIISAGAAAFNLVWSSLTLFNENILATHGFNAEVAVQLMAILTGAGLVANLIGGALASRERLGKLLACGLAVLAIALACFPQIKSSQQLYAYASALGLTGGIVTVVFFTAWGSLYGRTHLGRIQGAAQAITIVASAAGPELLARHHDFHGSYDGAFGWFAVMTGVAAIAAWFVQPPAVDAKPSTSA